MQAINIKLEEEENATFLSRFPVLLYPTRFESFLYSVFTVSMIVCRFSEESLRSGQSQNESGDKEQMMEHGSASMYFLDNFLTFLNGDNGNPFSIFITC